MEKSKGIFVQMFCGGDERKAMVNAGKLVQAYPELFEKIKKEGVADAAAQWKTLYMRDFSGPKFTRLTAYRMSKTTSPFTRQQLQLVRSFKYRTRALKYEGGVIKRTREVVNVLGQPLPSTPSSYMLQVPSNRCCICCCILLGAGRRRGRHGWRSMASGC